MAQMDMNMLSFAQLDDGIAADVLFNGNGRTEAERK